MSTHADLRPPRLVAGLGVMVVAAAALLGLAGWGAWSVLGGLSADSAEALSAHVVLQPHTAESDAAPLRAEIAAWPGVTGVTWRSSADNLAFLQRALGEPPEAVVPSAVPPSLVVHLHDPGADHAALQPQLQALAASPWVLSVELPEPADAAAVAELGRLLPAALLLGALALLGGVLLVAALQGSAALARREALEVLWHLGAERHQLARPFLRDSLAWGLLGGGAAGAALLALATFGRTLLVALGWSSVLPAEHAALGLPAAVALGLGLLVSLAGAALGLPSHLQLRTPPEEVRS